MTQIDVKTEYIYTALCAGGGFMLANSVLPNGNWKYAGGLAGGLGYWYWDTIKEAYANMTRPEARSANDVKNDIQKIADKQNSGISSAVADVNKLKSNQLKQLAPQPIPIPLTVNSNSTTGNYPISQRRTPDRPRRPVDLRPTRIPRGPPIAIRQPNHAIFNRWAH